MGVVVYWSGTGNTQEMASLLANDLGFDCYSVSEISAADAAKYDVVVLGCPAMGAEELEDSEFRPFFEEFMPLAEGKKLGLFGSYGWGDGEWMRSFEEEATAKGGNVVGTLTFNEAASNVDQGEYDTFVANLK